MNIYTLCNIRKCKRVYRNKKPLFILTELLGAASGVPFPSSLHTSVRGVCLHVCMCKYYPGFTFFTCIVFWRPYKEKRFTPKK